MSEHLRASLSALMDNQASEPELERILAQLHEPAVRDSLARYQAASAALRGGGARLDVSAAVLAAIESEGGGQRPAPARPGGSARGPGLGGLLRPLAGLAVAASVFAAVLVAGQWYWLAGDGAAAPPPQAASRAAPGGPVQGVGGATLNASYGGQATGSAGRLRYEQLARRQMRRHADANWRVNWLPGGFAPSGGAGGDKSFTDGRAEFSVYVERLERDIVPGEALVRQAGATAYARGLYLRRQPVLVTVVGELPAGAARRVADSVHWEAPGGAD